MKQPAGGASKVERRDAGVVRRGTRSNDRAFVAMVLLSTVWAVVWPERERTLAAAGAQSPAAMVEVDPIKCWWQTSAGAVRVGEMFELAITCAVLENETVQVVPDEAQLAVANVQLAPFEILGGSHPPDTRAGARRFLQYQYTLRLIDPGAFGMDVRIPQQQIHYRVQTQVAADASLVGRDLVYILPAIPIRVLSQVPSEEADIRDGTSGLAARAASLRTRAGLLEVVGLALVATGAVVLLAAVLRLAGRDRRAVEVKPGLAPEATIWGAVLRELEEVRRLADIEGWTAELLPRALTSMRVVAGGVGGGRISQVVLQPHTPTPDLPPPASGGRLLVEHGWWRKQRVSVASSTTAARLAGAKTNADVAALQGALETMTAALYGPGGARDRAAIDEAVSQATDAARRLVRERTGPLAWVRGRLAAMRR